MSDLRPRLCVMEKGPSGYGFHLHGEKGKTGQFIRLVEPDTPAAAAGLRAGDRLAFVNGERVEGESHQQVVARIRATTGSLELVVIDAETAELLKKHSLPCRREFVTEGVPVPDRDSDSDRGDAKEENGDVISKMLLRSSLKKERTGLRPRLCHLQRGANGYGFNLHSEKAKQGQYIRAVDEDSPAQRAGLRPQDKIVQVNGLSVISMQHSEVVAAIKAGGDETRLLVVDPETDEFFKRCNVLPTEEHITGRLPEPVSDSAAEEKEEVEDAPDQPSDTPSDTPSAADSLDLRMSLAQAKERAHQKRAAKKAPPMDWSKRNELFSNL